MTVTVIVLNFNGMTNQYLKACLDSLRRQSYPTLQCIVVDNASQDESAAYVEGLPDVQLIRCETALGFGQANNRGYALASGDFVLFANHDTVFDPHCIEQLVKAVELAPDIGMAAPKMLRPKSDPEAPTLLDSAGTLLRRDMTMYDRGFGVPDRGQFDASEFIFAPCGAAAFFRRSALDALRYEDGTLWDEDFFYYYEDGDLGWRVRNAGWRCIYYPAALAEHHRGVTMAPKFFGKTHAFKVHTIKNRYLMIAKNAPIRMMVWNAPLFLAREVLIWGYLLFHPRLLIDVWRALGPSMGRALAKRRKFAMVSTDHALFAGQPLSAGET